MNILFILLASLIVIAIAYYAFIQPMFLGVKTVEDNPEQESLTTFNRAEVLLAELEEHESEYKAGKISFEDYESIISSLKRELIKLKEEETSENQSPKS